MQLTTENFRGALYMRKSVALIILVAFGFAVAYWMSPMTWQSASSGASYYVRAGPGQDAVANRLDLLATRVRTLLDEADDMYPYEPRIANVRARWNGRLSETAGKNEIAYSMDKQDIFVCVRSPETGALEPVNTSMYVLLHELAHVATDAYGHPPEFWATFRWFLELAEKLGMYEYEDFDGTITTFCGHTLGNNVMRCVKDHTCPSLLKKK